MYELSLNQEGGSRNDLPGRIILDDKHMLTLRLLNLLQSTVKELLWNVSHCSKLTQKRKEPTVVIR